MAPSNVSTTAHDHSSPTALGEQSGNMDATSTQGGLSTHPINTQPLRGTKRAISRSPDRADSNNGDIVPMGQMAPGGPFNHSRSPSSSAGISSLLAGSSDVHFHESNSNGTTSNASVERESSGRDPAGVQWVYVGSFWYVQVSLKVAPAHDAELMAKYTTSSVDEAGLEVGLVEAFDPTKPTERDGKVVGSVLNKKFKHADQLATLLKEFRDQDLRVISRRKDTSQPFLDQVEAGSTLEPRASLGVANFKVFCKQQVRDNVARRLTAMKLPGAENIYVQRFTSKHPARQDAAVGSPAVTARHMAPSVCNEQDRSVTYPSAQVDPHLQAACASHKHPRSLTLFETPAQMKIPLREHQKTALSWMTRREKGNPLNDVFVREARGATPAVFIDAISGMQHQELPVTESGGILADDMGLGKTVTAVSFILCGEKDAQQWFARFGPGGNSLRSPATLLVVPPTLVGHWEREIRTKTTFGNEDLYVHFGPNRVVDRSALRMAKIVLTSSSLVSLGGERDRDMFFNTHWYRAMFDEAHEFRNSMTRLARNVLSIKARFRWAITGTPIHNYVSDIQPLLQLINAHPVASKDAFNKLVMRRIQTRPMDGSLVLKVLAGSYMIRRKAEDHMYSASFTHVRADVALTQEERHLYEEARSRVKVEIQHETSCHNALLRFHDMRKVCAMGMAARAYMQPSSAQAAHTPAARYQRVVTDGGASCHACGEVPSLESALGEHICFILSCAQQHVLCSTCFEKEPDRCPCDEGAGKVTSTPVTRTDLSDLDVEMMDLRDERPSAKIRFIKDEVKAYSGSKFVVMASYVSTVSEIIRVFDMEGVNYVRYDGSISQGARRANMAAFKNESGIQVLVGTIKSLGQGHSVEEASRLILVDVEWNPQVSEQAKARIIRLSQKNDATITQLIAKGTIEENILARAEDKKRLAEAFSDHWNVVEGPKESDLDLIKSWFRN